MSEAEADVVKTEEDCLEKIKNGILINLTKEALNSARDAFHEDSSKEQFVLIRLEPEGQLISRDALKQLLWQDAVGPLPLDKNIPLRDSIDSYISILNNIENNLLPPGFRVDYIYDETGIDIVIERDNSSGGGSWCTVF